MPHDVIMPALGMSQDTAQLIAWLKQPGDSVRAGDALMEVETDKAVVEVEAQADGFLTHVSAHAGDHVPVGHVVAVIAETAETAETVDSGDSGDSGDSLVAHNVASLSPPSADTDNPDESLPEGKEIIMPALGMAQDAGLIVAWRKNTGDAVTADDILFEVETDKSVMEVEAGQDGYVAAILADAQQAVPVGSVIAIISADKPDKLVTRGHVAVPTSPVSSNLAPVALTADTRQADAVDTQPEGMPGTGTASVPGGRILASPKARRLALELGLSLERLVEHGVPQPYHVADLEKLKELGQGVALPALTAEASAANAAALMQIAARVPAGGFDEFIDWMAKDEHIDLPACLVWLRYATAALRHATAADTERLIVEIKQVRGINNRYADADRSRLSQAPTDTADLLPDLVVRDFTGSPITSASVVVGGAAVLTIGREYDDYVITLDCQLEQLDETQAIHLITDFAERLGDPLLHLL